LIGYPDSAEGDFLFDAPAGSRHKSIHA